MSFSSLCGGGDGGLQLPSPARPGRNQSLAPSDVLPAISGAVPEFHGVDTKFRRGSSAGSVDMTAGLLGAIAPAMDVGMLEADQVQEVDGGSLPLGSSEHIMGSGGSAVFRRSGSGSSVSPGAVVGEVLVASPALVGGRDELMVDGEFVLRSGGLAGRQILHGADVTMASCSTPVVIPRLHVAVDTSLTSATVLHGQNNLPTHPVTCIDTTRKDLLDKSLLGAPRACPPSHILPNFQSASTILNADIGGAWRRPRMVALPLLSDIGEFSTDGHTALLDTDDVAATSNLFAGALVGRLFGRRIPFSVLSAELHRRWASFGSFKIVTLSSDCFFCLFDSVDARDAVLLGGPWVLFGQVLGIDRWMPTFSPCSSAGFCTPVWVRMPDFPLYSWSPRNMARVAAIIGEPVGIDEATAGLVRASFARVCVRMDLSKPLKPGVWVDGPYGKFYQSLVYEGLSVFCYRCGKVGHKESSCSQPTVTTGCSNGLASASSPLVETSTAGQPLLAPMTMVVDSSPLPLASAVAVGIDAPVDRGVGPWMTVTRKKKGGRGRPSISGRPVSSVTPNSSPLTASATQIGTGSAIHQSGSPALIFSGSSPSVVGALARSARSSKAQLVRASRTHNQRMLGDLGPVALDSRKRRKAPSLSDGGDASSSPPT